MNNPNIDPTGWRDQVPSQKLKAEILRKIPQRERLNRVRLLTAGLVGSGLGVAAFSTVILLGSSPLTLAQVIDADKKADSITIVNRRIMGPEKGNGFSITTKMVGGARFVSVMEANSTSDLGDFSYSDEKEGFRYFKRFNLAIYDQSSKSLSWSSYRRKVSDLVSLLKNPQVEKNIDWNGRKVTRFTSKLTLRTTDVDQELLVDQKTNLPIRFTSMRDHRSWGDEWTYDYSKFDASSIKPTLPKGTNVIDNRKLRARMKTLAPSAASGIPFIEISLYQVAILVKKSLVKQKDNSTFNLTLTTRVGKKRDFSGTWSSFSNQNLIIGKDSYYLFLVGQNSSDRYDELFGDKSSGSLNVFGKTFKFSNIPTIKTGDLYFLNSPFSEPKKGLRGSPSPHVY